MNEVIFKWMLKQLAISFQHKALFGLRMGVSVFLLVSFDAAFSAIMQP